MVTLHKSKERACKKCTCVRVKKKEVVPKLTLQFILT